MLIPSAMRANNGSMKLIISFVNHSVFANGIYGVFV